MRAKRLEVLGFKSFCEKTTVLFEHGVTAIVGPNGSGKTNLVDAVRWVIGEHNPRDLRAPRLEDVIFNGTDTRAPLSMGEVSLTFDNEDGSLPISFSEVTLTRRVYRSGESEYLINGAACRLRDIQELFLGTGLGGGTYAIIAQGHIDLVLSSKPEERRAVFEEASGVAKYLQKKQETERRLEQAEEDLIRVADIISEVRRQLNAIERQAAKARAYKTQWEQLKSLELRLAADELRKGEASAAEHQRIVEELSATRQTLESAKQQHLRSIETLNAAVAQVQGQLDGLRTGLMECTGRITQHTEQQQLKGRWIEELAQQREQRLVELAQVEERIIQFGAQTERLCAQQQELTGAHQDLATQRAGAQEDLGQQDGVIAGARRALEQLQAQVFAAASEAAHQRNALTSIAHQRQSLEARAAKLSERAAAARTQVSTLASGGLELAQQVQQLTDEKQQIEARVTAARAAATQTQGERQEASVRLNHLREQALTQQARAQVLADVYQRHEGFPESVKALLADPPEGVLGVLADLIEPQAGFDRAVDAALGPLVSAVVVRDREALSRCQARLNGASLDASNFIVLSDCVTQLPSLPESSLQAGALGALTAFVRSDPAFASLTQPLLGAWKVVDEINHLVPDSRPIGRWVSRAGDRCNGWNWQLAGGPASGESVRIGRRQRWEQATQDAESFAQQAQAAEAQVAAIEQRWQSLLSQEESLRAQMERAAAELSKLDVQLAQSHSDQRRAADELSGYEMELADLSSQQRELSTAAEAARSSAAQAETSQREADASLAQAAQQVDAAVHRRQELLVAMAQHDSAIQGLRERETSIQARLDELQAQQRQEASAREEKKTQLEAASVRLADLSREVEEHRRQVTALTEEQGRAQAQVDQAAAALKVEEQQRDQAVPQLVAVEQELFSASQALAQQETKAAEWAHRKSRVLERLQEVYQIDEPTLQAEGLSAAALGEDERAVFEEQVGKLKAKLQTMGPVSLGSVEEFDELTKRLEFLKGQQQDLGKARDDLKEAIAQINRTARAQFKDTFVKIQEQFVSYFTRLFGGGQAQLILLDENDVLTSGIEIIARPPGKRPQSITLLSGGERALTAIALLFALFTVRPSPLCILDEIDAPLDEANIDRFTKVLEEFLQLSQFILITHNKKTITKADSIYGVTQEEAGISKIVSVKLAKRATIHGTAAPAAVVSSAPTPA